MQQKSPMLRLWELSSQYHGGLIRAVISASVGVLCGMLPYFAAARIIIGLMNGNRESDFYVFWCIMAFAGYLLRSCLYALALSMSHKATFSTLKSIREQILAKLPKMPLGTVMDTSSGEMKQIIVDQVESMERPLAHLLPEMTSNIFGPVCIFIYLFILDWRMALLSLVSIPVGMAFMMAVMKNYGKQYEGSVKVTQAMNSTIVEYINGIEVIKAFNQGKNSYARFSDRVLANAAYFYNWMKSCQLPVSVSKTVAPTTMITILPAGWIMYQTGTLGMDIFLTTIILSLGIAGPLLAAMDFVDSLAKVGTTVSQIDSILDGKEQHHGMTPVHMDSTEIRAEHVSFGYHHDKEILHDISLTIPEGTMTAFVGPSGAGKTTLVNLIPRFYDVTEGSVLLDGVDVRELRQQDLRAAIGYVPQKGMLFSGTIASNLRYGDENADEKTLQDACDVAQASEFIEHLVNGLDAGISQGGTNVSGGQRQRLSIARALVKKAPVYIFDDTFSALDFKTDAKLRKALKGYTEHSTVLVVAQRVSSIMHAEQIVVLDEGRVAGIGTHEELLKTCETYREIAQSQLSKEELER